MDIAQHLAGARERAGLTQAQLAERAGTAQSAISAYESGRKVPSADTFVRLLAAAGAQLQVVEREPVRAASRAEIRRRGEILEQVIELAEALPVRHAPALRYPVLRDLVATARAERATADADRSSPTGAGSLRRRRPNAA